ncbi:hypothetical protein Hamer_G001134 [Homarus americanus]|uniref:Uncharacterized protein n=1 Tax=Homarus americanus TaxID=6706 RepID=A0A8J5N2U2_HOMAM|nr:hypothetical protein Hamer_G001134 [Homarus americanus]
MVILRSSPCGSWPPPVLSPWPAPHLVVDMVEEDMVAVEVDMEAAAMVVADMVAADMVVVDMVAVEVDMEVAALVAADMEAADMVVADMVAADMVVVDMVAVDMVAADMEAADMEAADMVADMESKKGNIVLSPGAMTRYQRDIICFTNIINTTLQLTEQDANVDEQNYTIKTLSYKPEIR